NPASRFGRRLRLTRNMAGTTSSTPTPGRCSSASFWDNMCLMAVPWSRRAKALTNKKTSHYSWPRAGAIEWRFLSSSRKNLRNLWSAMLAEFEKQLSQTLAEIKSQGLYKTERIITTPQDAHIAVAGGKRVLNMCANNYLGLAD